MTNQTKVTIGTIAFILSMIFAFWLINFDEMIKAFIGITIINGWFFAILMLNLTGKIKFADEMEEENQSSQDHPD